MKHNNKHIYIAGDLNFNLLDYSTNKKVKSFVDTLLQHSLLPTINKPTRVTKKSATLIDNIITNIFNHQSNFDTGIIETDISDHFPTFLICDDADCDYNSSPTTTIFKRTINERSMINFHKSLQEANRELVAHTNNVNNAYDTFLHIFSKLYDKAFPKKEVSIKKKSLFKPMDY